ncbi:hypothetical protein CR513_55386, partial [Mucuna pruriens]
MTFTYHRTSHLKSSGASYYREPPSLVLRGRGPAEGRSHNQPLYIAIKCGGYMIAKLGVSRLKRSILAEKKRSRLTPILVAEITLTNKEKRDQDLGSWKLSKVITRYSQRTPMDGNLNVWPSLVRHFYPSIGDRRGNRTLGKTLNSHLCIRFCFQQYNRPRPSQFDSVASKLLSAETRLVSLNVAKAKSMTENPLIKLVPLPGTQVLLSLCVKSELSRIPSPWNA